MSLRHLTSVLSFAALMTGAEAARAEDDRPEAIESPTSANQAASTGAFLPFTLRASSVGTLARGFSGYDGARRAAIYEGVADAHVVDHLSIRAGYASHDLSGHASALIGARLQFLSRERHGVDLGAGLFYMPQDIDGEGLMKASLVAGTKVGNLALFISASYGQDPEGDDHQPELALGMVAALAPAVFVGFDGRLRALVLSSDAKHNGLSMPVVDVAAGPLAHYVLGPVVLTSQIGMSALVVEGPHGSSRSSRETKYGPLGILSAGFAL